jgi:hypothetical protein
LPETGVLYFGCWADVGHFLYGRGRKRIAYGDSPVPNLDGGYVPNAARGSTPEGIVRLTNLDGWTILGFRDNSVDSRGGSHSTFLVPGDVSYDEALANARAAFPFVFRRIETRGISIRPEISPVAP